MEKYLRDLERIYQSSGDPQDIFNYYAALMRGPLYSFFEETLNDIVIQKDEDIQQFGPNARYWGLGSLKYAHAPVTIFLAMMRLGSIRGAEYQIEYLQGKPPGLTLFIYTLSQEKRACPYCQIQGPHLCHRYINPLEHLTGHPYRGGAGIPVNYRAYGLSAPLKSWEPSKPRRMGQEYFYTIHQWVIQPYPSGPSPAIPSDHSLFLGDGWYLITIREIGHKYSSSSLLTRVKDNEGYWQDAGIFRNKIELDDIVDPQNPNGNAKLLFSTGGQRPGGLYYPIYDAREQVFPIEIGHELPEPPPQIILGPCSEFERLPKGDFIFIPELGQQVPTGGVVTIYEERAGELAPSLSLPQAERIFDTTTRCGHGYQFGMPLCPPTWSDTGEVAAIHCDSCNRLLPPDHQSYDPYHRCESCQKRMDRQQPSSLAYLRDYLMEPGEGMWYFCQDCEDNADGGYMEENHCYCFELAEEEGTEPPELEIRYRCPFCVQGSHNYYSKPSPYDYKWYTEMQNAFRCCTAITPWDFSQL